MWSDRETEKDCLGYISYVNVLADVCLHKDLAPLTLGLFGSWGSGKTSLMWMLKRRIDKLAAKTKTLWFNAWKYEAREEAQSALIHAIIAKLSENKDLVDKAQDILKRLKDGASILKLAKAIGKSAITMTPDIEGLVDSFREESEKIAETMEKFDNDFAELLKRMEVERIVVFIDDLDRCSSAKVIETFETIKLFLNTPSCTFVIGADAPKIEHAVGEIYNVTDTKKQKDYLEKIIQIPFSIPEQSLRDIACYIGMLIIGRHLDEKGWEELVKARHNFYRCEGEIAEAFRSWPKENQVYFNLDTGITEVIGELDGVLPYVDILGRGLRGNPRQIKRFLNILSLRRRLAEANELSIKADLLVKMTVLEYVWGNFFNAIVETIDPLTGHSALIEEVLKADEEESGTSSDSPLVTTFLGGAFDDSYGLLLSSFC